MLPNSRSERVSRISSAAAFVAVLAAAPILSAATSVAVAREAVVARAPVGAAARRHTRLVKSAPAKDDTLAAPPKSLDLWFSEPVDLSLLRVTLAGPGAANIALGKAAQAGTGKDAHVTVPVAGVMGAGAYAVTWVVAGADGHPTRGSFAFRLKSGR